MFWRNTPERSASVGTFGSSGLNVTPNVGARATFYDRSATTVEPTDRKYFYAGADVNARVSRVYGTDGDVGIGAAEERIALRDKRSVRSQQHGA